MPLNHYPELAPGLGGAMAAAQVRHAWVTAHHCAKAGRTSHRRQGVGPRSPPGHPLTGTCAHQLHPCAT